MKKIIVKCLLLTCVLTTVTVSKGFANISQSSGYQQQQIEQIRQQNDALRQQNEYLMQQTEILKQQADAQRQSQAYNQGYIEGQGNGQGQRQRSNNGQLYAGMGLGYMMGQLYIPRYGYGWGHGCGYGWGRGCGRCRH